MKLWKVLARNSHIYTKEKGHMMELQEYKSRSPTYSEDSGRHSSSALDDPQLLLTTVQLRKRAGEPLGIVLGKKSSLPNVFDRIRG
ncbi:Glutamate receptor-interacting protein 2-like Protein [Tribolium castaneum]|uniref:Glutamate receptor-interacting protein 2-like Protein n=1 Tax=Tribolium castaneum TaxID=7070 RepID=A0A139WBQ0_TRICA|nr:Glutamate receptor-interacting protein 2-like Protein [Tribolium castaneum]